MSLKNIIAYEEIILLLSPKYLCLLFLRPIAHHRLSRCKLLQSTKTCFHSSYVLHSYEADQKDKTEQALSSLALPRVIPSLLLQTLASDYPTYSMNIFWLVALFMDEWVLLSAVLEAKIADP